MKTLINQVVMLLFGFASFGQADLKKLDLPETAKPALKQVVKPALKKKSVELAKKKQPTTPPPSIKNTKIDQPLKAPQIGTTKTETKHYDKVYDNKDGLAKVKQFNKYGFIDNTKKEVIPCSYDYAGDFQKGMVVVKMGNKAGILDKKGRAIYPCFYEDARIINNIPSVKKDGKWLTK